MLNDDQVRMLLEVGESAVGQRLDKIRGDLRTARNRGAAIWELLVIEAAVALGKIQYERCVDAERTGGPDVYLEPATGQAIWIEAAYLFGRFHQKDRRAVVLLRRFYQETELRRIPARTWVQSVSMPMESDARNAKPADVQSRGRRPRFSKYSIPSRRRKDPRRG